jgi:hypothetical protein
MKAASLDLETRHTFLKVMPQRDPAIPAKDLLTSSAEAYFAECRSRIGPFVHRTFGIRGTLALHRHALGWDLLRAPVNLLLAIAYLVQRVLTALLSVLRLSSAARWLRDRPLMLQTDVGTVVERRVLIELFDLPVPPDAPRATWAEAVLSARQLREVLRATGSVEATQETARTALQNVNDYAATRNAVADIVTAIMTLLIGGLLLHSLTPGMISMAPSLATTLAEETAIADFPLGEGIGATWYWMFPAQPGFWGLAGAFGALMVLASVVSVFSGLLADPIQVWLGLHRRRLLRLVTSLEQNVRGTSARFAAPEHYGARLLDMADAAVTAVRHLRG